jgi:uronate dehydrogenase
VLITGAGGLIGGILGEGLEGDYELTRLDVRRGPAVQRVDMRKLKAAERAFAGAEVVIDLAAIPRVSSSWEEVYENNLPATANALEAARRAGARRLIFASSSHVTGGYERDDPYAAIVGGDYAGLDPEAIPRITVGHPIRPDSPYGVGKALGEAAGRHYADAHGLSVICLRIGSVNAQDRPRNAREFATLLTSRDLVRLVECCIRASAELGFAIFYGVSANAWRFWEIADAEKVIGYRPADDAEAFRAQA